MENLGQKITKLRKEKNLTQAELGEKLNVTSQAVSKWENNLSEPDLETTKKLCEIFEISMNELLQLTETTTPAPTEPTPVIIERVVEKNVETPPAKIILGYCKKCNKPVSNGEYVAAGRIGILCNECNAQREASLAEENKKFNVKQFRTGIIWGAIAFTLILAAGLITALTVGNSFFTIFGPALALAYMASTLIAECIWDGSALDVLGFFCRSFTMPGIIFSWSWDGLKFLIIMKIVFAIISAALSVFVFLIGLVVSLVYSAILFPYSLGATIKELKESCENVDHAKNL